MRYILSSACWWAEYGLRPTCVRRFAKTRDGCTEARGARVLGQDGVVLVPRVQTQLIKARMPRRQRGTGLRSSSERVCRSALRCA